MSLADAFAGMKKAQEPERSGTQAPKHPSVQGPKLLSTQVPKALPLQNTAKSSHPEYTAVKIFVRKQTHKAAGRKWEDADGGDFSDLVEQLLQKYLST
jgi:hypothetical protein